MSTSKADRAYEILKQRIMDGTFGPGHRLVIDQLAREFDISSVPWRESLRRLEAEGWVTITRNVGALVTTFDTDAWQRTIRLLAALEGLATSLSAPHLTPDDIAQAREFNARARQALADFDMQSFGQANRQFHQLVCSRCGDDRLIDLVRTEWTRLDLIRRSAFYYAPGRALASVTEHDHILDLIEQRADPEEIDAAARRHELNTLAAVVEHDRQQAASLPGGRPASGVRVK
ncbi:MAG TPA: GntR family transcriptional regulator [Nocardioides sp.]|uniref:GntR family transcriptional regulator n=1 Tax=Nocardioides sp. TaxID=35761 RepID=UPI002C9C4A45|nr:GntR family transcriptional regulator [Nocardioides sp.]HTW15623.1 GntR family transcriptional regulator [Nocardioides sp.]